jgi:hypothetical protein
LILSPISEKTDQIYTKRKYPGQGQDAKDRNGATNEDEGRKTKHIGTVRGANDTRNEKMSENSTSVRVRIKATSVEMEETNEIL